MSSLARQYTSFCHDLWRRHQQTPLPAVESLMRLNDGLMKASKLKEGDPNFGIVFAAIQEHSANLVTAMRHPVGGQRFPPIPEAIHLLRTALRQPGLAAKVAKEISASPFVFSAN